MRGSPVALASSGSSPARRAARAAAGAAVASVVLALAPLVRADPAPAPVKPLSADAAREALASQDAPARDPDPSCSRQGVWLGVGAGYALQDFSLPGGHDDAADVAFRAGYRGLPWLGVEFLGEVLTTFDADDSRAADVDGYLVSVNARAIAPLGRVEPWLMAGLGVLDVDTDRRSRRDDFAFRSAAGVDLYLTAHWVLYGEASYLLPTGDVERFDYATFGAGILFRF